MSPTASASSSTLFSLLRKNGGKAFTVYMPESEAKFAQNDALLQAGRVHGYGPCGYSAASFTSKWIRHALAGMVERLAQERARALAGRVTRPPHHNHADPLPPGAADAVLQGTLFGVGAARDGGGGRQRRRTTKAVAAAGGMIMVRCD